jgi:hypothetical protein
MPCANSTRAMVHPPLVSETAQWVILTTPRCRSPASPDHGGRPELPSFGSAGVGAAREGVNCRSRPWRGAVLDGGRPGGAGSAAGPRPDLLCPLMACYATSLAALYDGEQYLLERHVRRLTPASHTRLKDLPRPQWTGLASGSPKRMSTSRLPAVPDELRSIIRDPTQPEPRECYRATSS